MKHLEELKTTFVDTKAETLAKVPADEARRAIAELKALRLLYQGDFYPLLEINTSEHGWCAWQYDRPDLGQGFAVFFRRPQCPPP